MVTGRVGQHSVEHASGPPRRGALLRPAGGEGICDSHIRMGSYRGSGQAYVIPIYVRDLIGGRPGIWDPHIGKQSCRRSARYMGAPHTYG